MRTSTLLTLTATLSIAMLAGCNWSRKGSKGLNSNFGPGGPGGPGTGEEIGLIVDDLLVNAQEPFDRYKDFVDPSQTGLEVVYFAFDSSTLPPAELYKIDRAGAYLQSNPSHVMIIEGHCDERGSAEYNLSLGEFRAQAVRNYLVNLGIAGNRLQTRSYGFEKPAVIGSTEAAFAQNRRAVFAVYK